jgi:hypothetical protein
MAKFIVVSKAPETLEKGEFVINQPNFMEEVIANKQKAPRNQQTAVNHLREVLQSVGVKYDPELNAMRIKLVNYTGLPYKNNEELAAIVTRILRNEYPAVFPKVIAYELAHRPAHTQLVYYVGNSEDCAPFFAAGLDSTDPKEAQAHLTGKSKKAAKATDESAEDNNE